LSQMHDAHAQRFVALVRAKRCGIKKMMSHYLESDARGACAKAQRFRPKYLG
jgi:hypothetical protein